MQFEGVVVSEADGQVFVRGRPVAGRPAICRDGVMALLEQAGCSECVLDEDAIAQAVADANGKDVPFAVLVAQRKDAQIDVEVAPDAMSARLSLCPAQGGKPATIEDVLQALLLAGVSIGVDHATLAQACKAQLVDKITIAQGTPPQEGSDSDFAELVPQSSDRAPKVDESGLIDYREHGAITMVEAGVALMRRIPAVPGVDGVTVLGQPLPAGPVRDAPFSPNLKGAVTSESDPNLLMASAAGLPVRVPCGVVVEPVLSVREVNLATGNINFDGCVQIEGDVIQNMKVQASGDIFVGGTVEGGMLDAQGNISIRGGVIADSKVRAAGSVSARFAEASSLSSGTVLAIDDSALGCDLLAKNQILIGLKAPQRGRLVGGTATAKMLLRVPVLGSSKSGQTKVAVGADPEMERQYLELNERIAAEKANEENLHKLCSHLVAIKDPKGMLERAKTSWRQAAQTWGKSLAERAEMDKLREQTLNSRLEIGVETSGAVEITFGAIKTQLRKEYPRGAFSINTEARLVFTGADGKAFAVS